MPEKYGYFNLNYIFYKFYKCVLVLAVTLCFCLQPLDAVLPA